MTTTATQNKPRKFTTTQDTGTGPVTVSTEVGFPVPSKGDTLNIFGHEILVEDIKVGIDFDFDETARKYTGKVRRTTDGTERIVFWVKPAGSSRFDHTWREGEFFTRKEGGAK